MGMNVKILRNGLFHLFIFRNFYLLFIRCVYFHFNTLSPMGALKAPMDLIFLANRAILKGL